MKEFILPDKVTIATSFFAGKNFETIKNSENFVAVERGAFNNCKNLKEINLENVKKIETYAFLGCSSLKNIRLSSKIKIIEKNTFKNCTELEEVIIPKTVVEICDNAFVNCVACRKIKVMFIKNQLIMLTLFYFCLHNMPVASSQNI